MCVPITPTTVNGPWLNSLAVSVWGTWCWESFLWGTSTRGVSWCGCSSPSWVITWPHSSPTMADSRSLLLPTPTSESRLATTITSSWHRTSPRSQPLRTRSQSRSFGAPSNLVTFCTRTSRTSPHSSDGRDASTTMCIGYSHSHHPHLGWHLQPTTASSSRSHAQGRPQPQLVMKSNY